MSSATQSLRKVPNGSTITAVLLDLDDTLISDKPARDKALRATARLAHEKYGVDSQELSGAVLNHARELWHRSPSIEYCRKIGISSWEGLWAPWSTTSHPALAEQAEWCISFRIDAWHRGLITVGIDDIKLAEDLACVYQRRRRKLLAGLPGVAPLVRWLVRHYRVGIVTNGASDLQREKIAATGIEHLVHAVIISGDIGIKKPAPEIFHIALTRLNVHPENTVMVGDNVRRDLIGAKMLGIRTVWLRSSGDRNQVRDTADVEIDTLSELPEVLKKMAGV